MISPDDLRGVPLFHELAGPRLQKIALSAGDIRLRAGEWLTQEGDTPAFYILLEGTVELFNAFDGQKLPLIRFEAGDYVGEIPLLLGSTVIASMQAATDARVARLAGPDFLELIMHSERLAAHVLQTMASRVSSVQERSITAPRGQIALFGRAADEDCYDLRQFLSGNSLPFSLSQASLAQLYAAQSRRRETQSRPWDCRQSRGVSG